MAAIDDLLLRVEDPDLRARLQQEFMKLSKQKKFGLVFEEHLPECTPLYEIPMGSQSWKGSRSSPRMPMEKGKMKPGKNALQTNTKRINITVLCLIRTGTP